MPCTKHAYRSSGNIRIEKYSKFYFHVGKFRKFFLQRHYFYDEKCLCLHLHAVRANIRNNKHFVIFIFVIAAEYEINFTSKISRTTVDHFYIHTYYLTT